MKSKVDILNELVEAVAPNHTKQLDEAGLAQAAMDIAKKAAPVAALITPTILALRKKKLPTNVRPGQVAQFAKDMMKARTKQQAVSAAAGLLHICAKVLLSVPELRELGHKINGVLLSPTLMDYLGGGE